MLVILVDHFMRLGLAPMVLKMWQVILQMVTTNLRLQSFQVKMIPNCQDLPYHLQDPKALTMAVVRRLPSHLQDQSQMPVSKTMQCLELHFLSALLSLNPRL
jgi:hypothetical protein